jgi:hypothetical protein
MINKLHTNGAVEVIDPRSVRLYTQNMAGTGTIECVCKNHRNRCQFGRPHAWSTPWVDTSDVWHHTWKCATCTSVCLEED